MSSEESFDYGGGGYEYGSEPEEDPRETMGGREEGSIGEFSGSEDGDGDVSEAESVEEQPEREGEIEYGETFADIQRTAGGAIKTAAGVGGGKAGRTPEQAALEKAQGIITGENMYSGVTESEKERILSLISKIPNVERCSIEVLVPALLFKVKKLDLQKNFSTFFKSLEGIEAADLLRYIRQYAL